MNSEEIQSGIRSSLNTLFEPDAVVELRALSDRKTVSGYFNDHDALAKEATELTAAYYNVYVTLNQVNPQLLARSSNKTKAYPKSTTADADIIRINWLPLDFDPVRPSGVSSTKEEKEAARLCAKEVRKYLGGEGWPDPIIGDSGNGWHLLYYLDLPATEESRGLVKDALQTLAFHYDTEKVKVDTSVHNPARIWKLYGTVSRKGDSVEKRPHRLSRILHVNTKEKV